jgi:hypothetical protein
LFNFVHILEGHGTSRKEQNSWVYVEYIYILDIPNYIPNYIPNCIPNYQILEDVNNMFISKTGLLLKPFGSQVPAIQAEDLTAALLRLLDLGAGRSQRETE